MYCKEFSKNTQCPHCSENRYDDGTHNPRKTFKYLPLLPRIQRWYGNPVLAKLLQSHLKPESEVIDDLHQSPAWKARYSKGGIYEDDTRALSFSFCSDGLNPFAHEKVTYSMWPITLSILNLPKNIRTKFGSLLLVGIIPGPKEPQLIDTYLQVLVDDIQHLSGSEVYDAYMKQKFVLRASIMLNILDYPGQNKIFHCNGERNFISIHLVSERCVCVYNYMDCLCIFFYHHNRRTISMCIITCAVFTLFVIIIIIVYVT